MQDELTKEQQTLKDMYHALTCVFEATSKTGFDDGLRILEKEYQKMRTDPCKTKP